MCAVVCVCCLQRQELLINLWQCGEWSRKLPSSTDILNRYHTLCTVSVIITQCEWICVFDAFQ